MQGNLHNKIMNCNRSLILKNIFHFPLNNASIKKNNREISVFFEEKKSIFLRWYAKSRYFDGRKSQKNISHGLKIHKILNNSP